VLDPEESLLPFFRFRRQKTDGVKDPACFHNGLIRAIGRRRHLRHVPNTGIQTRTPTQSGSPAVSGLYLYGKWRRKCICWTVQIVRSRNRWRSSAACEMGRINRPDWRFRIGERHLLAGARAEDKSAQLDEVLLRERGPYSGGHFYKSEKSDPSATPSIYYYTAAFESARSSVQNCPATEQFTSNSAANARHVTLNQLSQECSNVGLLSLSPHARDLGLQNRRFRNIAFHLTKTNCARGKRQLSTKLCDGRVRVENISF